MSRAKTAKVTRLDAFNVACPECGHPAENPETGSQVWIPGEDKRGTGRITCCECWQPFDIPSSLSRLYAAKKGE
jgi:hypothetical protein